MRSQMRCRQSIQIIRFNAGRVSTLGTRNLARVSTPAPATRPTLQPVRPGTKEPGSTALCTALRGPDCWESTRHRGCGSDVETRRGVELILAGDDWYTIPPSVIDANFGLKRLPLTSFSAGNPVHRHDHVMSLSNASLERVDCLLACLLCVSTN